MKVKAKLKALHLRNETVDTHVGLVTFDKDGISELEVEESDMPHLEATGWLLDASPAPLGDVSPSDATREDGPTIEQYVAAGYLPERYPPFDYPIKPSPGLDAWVKRQTDPSVALPWDEVKVQAIRDAQANAHEPDPLPTPDPQFDVSDSATQLQSEQPKK
jgi:hypothetical protein